MTLLERVPLLGKALIPLLIMGSVFSVTLALGVVEMSRTVEAYRQILAHSAPAVLRITQLSHLTSEIGYSVDRNLVYVCKGRDAAQCVRTHRDFQSAVQGGDKVIDEAIRFDPAHRGDYARFKAEFRDCAEPADRAMALGMQDLNDAAKAIMAPVNDRILKLRDELDGYASRRAAENRALGLALERNAQATMATMVAVGALAALLGLSLAAWVAVAETAAPLAQLTSRMVRLADGDLSVEIAGQDRRDEIGAMARALQIFKDSAKAKLAAEVEARRSREAAAEASRQAQTEMARIARVLSMGELASSIAHEISQPVAAIVANTQAALRWLDHAPPNIDRARAAMERSLRDGQRAGSVIQRVRSMIARNEPALSALDVNGLVNDTLEFTEDERRRADIRLVLQLGRALPHVEGDPIQLQQVLLNLILNGIDALRDSDPADRVMTIATSSDEDQRVTVTVQDNGAGCEPDQHGQLFEPFFTTKPGGIGMGLPISRTIIEAHGGSIWFQPAHPRGSSFSFRLPPLMARPTRQPASSVA